MCRYSWGITMYRFIAVCPCCGDSVGSSVVSLDTFETEVFNEAARLNEVCSVDSMSTPSSILWAAKHCTCYQCCAMRNKEVDVKTEEACSTCLHPELLRQ
jgi:hypothetical protein